MCKHGWTYRFGISVMHSSGPKDAQVQSYSPGGANVPSWHFAVTCRITLNHPPTAAMRLMSNYFDHALSLDTPTQTVAQIARRFEPSTVLWAFHTIQPSSYDWCVAAEAAIEIIGTSGYIRYTVHRSLWRHWWRHKSESIRDREKLRPPRPMKSSELSNGENRITLR